MKNVSGFTLIETIIVMAVMTIAMLGVGFQMSMNEKSNDAIRKDLAFVELVKQVETAATSTATCTASLLGTIPVAGSAATLNSGTTTFAAGTHFQDPKAQVLIQTLNWATIVAIPGSSTEKIGYLSMQVDLSNGAGNSIAGGNMRNFPKSGSLPPGIPVHISVNPISGKVTSCGQLAGNPTNVKFFHISFYTTTNSDQIGYSGTTAMPGIPFPDNAYYITCGMDFASHGAVGKFFGDFYIVRQYPGSVDWHWTEWIDDWQPAGTLVGANYVAYYP